MDDDDPQKLADELEDDAKDLEEKFDSLGEEISEVREDWLRKREDDSVPGAIPTDDPIHEHDHGSPGDSSSSA